MSPNDENRRKSHLFSGVLLLGIGVLALSGYWWPGIMFVIGIAMIANGIAMKKSWHEYSTAAILIAIGAVFQLERSLDFRLVRFWPLFFIILGLILIFSKRRR